jgi:hypothetical protein
MALFPFPTMRAAQPVSGRYRIVAPQCDWGCACRVFQKRHLLAHKMGVIDEEYLQKANDPGAVAGRKIHVSHDEVNSAISIVETLGRRLFGGVLPATP